MTPEVWRIGWVAILALFALWEVAALFLGYEYTFTAFVRDGVERHEWLKGVIAGLGAWALAHFLLERRKGRHSERGVDDGGSNEP